MATLYHAPRSRSFRVLWTLEELQLPYTLEVLPFPPRALAKAYLGVNPLGTVPLFLDKDVRMTESCAICQYLAGRHSPGGLGVLPSERGYSDYLNYLSFGEATLMFPLAVYLRYTKVEPSERRLPQAAEDYRRFFFGRLRNIDALLADGRQYICADRFTVADISVGYSLLFAENNALQAEFPVNVSNYLARLKSITSFEKARKIESSAPLSSLAP